MAHKALALFSGGLDSILAVMLIRKQGIPVEGITFSSVFYDIRTAEIEAKKINLPLHIIDFNETIFRLIQNPEYGYGKNLNPCIDCHLWMIKTTKKMMKKFNADFIITGEVVGERPKSQKFTAMNLIANKSETKEILLRPLSARLLNPTKPELEGIIDRNQLMKINGRSRKPQIKLAKELQITDYPTPAGGCLLTVPSFSARLKVHLNLNLLKLEDIEPLKYGRHFFSQDFSTKIIVGRDAIDNIKLLKSMKNDYYFIFLDDWNGPVTIVKFYKDINELYLLNAGALALRYSNLRDKGESKVSYTKINTNEKAHNLVNYYIKNNFIDFNEKFSISHFHTSPQNYNDLNFKLI